MAEKPTEQEFIDRYEGYAARRCARDLYRAMYPTGMHTNGPTMVLVNASHLEFLLRNFKCPAEGKGSEQ